MQIAIVHVCPRVSCGSLQQNMENCGPWSDRLTTPDFEYKFETKLLFMNCKKNQLAPKQVNFKGCEPFQRKVALDAEQNSQMENN